MPKFSVLFATCLNDSVPIDPMPTFNALVRPRAVFSKGDWIYGDGTSNRNALFMDGVMFPRGAGMQLTVGAAVGGKLPTGALTVAAGGTGHPINLAGTFLFWVRDATTGAETAFGYATTNGSGVVTAATLTYGGKAGDYTNVGSRTFTEDTDLWTLAHPQAWAYRSKHVVYRTQAMQVFRQTCIAQGVQLFLAADDHEAWNGGYPGAYVTKSPPTVTTQAQSYQFWQTASDGVRGLLDQDFHNPPWTAPTTPFVPNGLTGLGLTGTEPFFKIRYFYVDFDASGNIVAKSTSLTPPVGVVSRCIVLDCLFEKGNYTIGSDDSSRNLISPVQEAWLDAVQAAAVAGGVRTITVVSSKDRYGQNSDGWISFQTQWNRIVARIQSQNYPTHIITGDRHVPHAARDRVANGDPWDGHIICPTALGATSDAIQQYDQCDWVDQSPDVPVLGSAEYDPDLQRTTLCIHDMATGRVKYGIRIPWGSRVAAEKDTYQSAPTISPAAPKPATANQLKYRGTWAARPTAGLLAGDLAWFTDVGVGAGSQWVWDGTYYAPCAPVVLFRAAGRLGAPLATLTGVTGGTFATPGSVPAGMVVKPGMRLESLANFARSTATATATLQMAIGGQNIEAASIVATANQHMRFNSNLWAVNAANQLVENWAGMNGSSANSMVDRTVDMNTAQSYTLSLTSANAADSFTLLSYSLTLYP